MVLHATISTEILRQIENKRQSYLMKLYEMIRGAGMAQSVQRLATGWTTERLEFESR
jgi:hypothetical protein